MSGPGDLVELRTIGVAAGGDAIAREDGGRIVFVEGALPGEVVRARLRTSKRDYAKATVVEVVEASVDRVAPPCPNVARGCGGCQWQHVAPAAQSRLKRDIVVDALRRLGQVPDADAVVAATRALPPSGYRTTVRMAVVGGRAAHRRRHSNEPVTVDECLVLHPLLAELVADGDFGRASEVSLRCGARTGERLVVADPTTAGIRLPTGVGVVRPGADAVFHEEVAGRRWRISAESFFQVRPDGADLLAELVLDAAGNPSTVVDLYAGVGLFAGVLGELGASVVAVEGHAPSAADAAANLDGLDATVVEADVHAWTPQPADVVVADPSRHGLGSRGVDVVAACAPDAVALVSCDPAALGRDVALLAARGLRLTLVVPVDLFGHTVHVETVSRFVRA